MQRIVAYASQQLPEFLNTAPKPCFLRFTANLKVSLLVAGTVVGESKEVDRFWPLLLSMGEPPELNQPGFIRFQLQPKLAQSFWQHIQETLRIAAMLETYDKIINVSD